MKKRNVLFAFLFFFAAAISAFLALLSIPLSIVFLVAVSVVTLVFISPFFGLLLYIFLLFARPQDFVPGLERMRLVLVLAILVLLSFFIRKAVRREPVSLFATRNQILMFVLLIIVPVSNIANLQMKAAWDGLIEFLNAFLLFFIVVNIVDNLKRFRLVCRVLVFCTVLVCINGLVQRFRGVDLVGETLAGGRVRWIGIFHDPNDFALLINSVIPFVLVSMFERERNLPERIGLLLISVLFLLNIYYTGSRGGYVALTAVVVFLSLQRWGMLKGAIAAAVFLTVVLLFAPSRLENLSPHEASASGRIYAWTKGLVMLKSRPVLGIGYMRFTAVHGRAAHSAFVSCFAEMGILGYFVWLSIIYGSFADLVAARKAPVSKQHRKYAGMLLLSLTGFLGSALFLSQAYNPMLYLLCALVTALVRLLDAPLMRPRLLAPREALLIAALIAGTALVYKAIAILYT